MSRMPLPRRRFALRPISVAACLLGGAQAAFALPQGAVPTFGQTTVNQTAPGQLNIQQGTQRAGIDWTSFSIGAGERVVVQQPNSSSVLLNRVLGSDPSQIYGSLQSNGSVWLINPRGIVFGAGSRVDVGGLVASTLSITSQDVASGRLVLGRGAAGAGDITSAGSISAPGGTVVLAAPQLTQSGSIDARRVGLVAATDVKVNVEGDGLIFFDVRNDGSLPARLSLLGNVSADGGTADIRAAARAGFADTVLNLEGVVRARSIDQRNGQIVIDGGSDGITRVAGTLDASGAKPGQQRRRHHRHRPEDPARHDGRAERFRRRRRRSGSGGRRLPRRQSRRCRMHSNCWRGRARRSPPTPPKPAMAAVSCCGPTTRPVSGRDQRPRRRDLGRRRRGRGVEQGCPRLRRCGDGSGAAWQGGNTAARSCGLVHRRQHAHGLRRRG